MNYDDDDDKMRTLTTKTTSTEEKHNHGHQNNYKQEIRCSYGVDKVINQNSDFCFIFVTYTAKAVNNNRRSGAFTARTT